MNDSNEVQELRKRVEANERTVHRLKLAVTVFGVALLVLAVAFYNANLRALLGGVLAVAGILFAVLLFMAGIRLVLERLSPSQQDRASSGNRVGHRSRSEEAP